MKKKKDPQKKNKEGSALFSWEMIVGKVKRSSARRRAQSKGKTNREGMCALCV